ncbi:GAF domain-containing protein [Burkholderia sp. Bp9031]|uniref:ATP-binding sensor histidine kinase n=1 Tax=Burkholderia sp. Bp9031 TaxID=2184566 RepID=UPI000F5F17CB|nr:ATP-binding sensor histidine kinase [Burkholderia sp. Bp9031]RQZ18841.1 GAF domain-containing protein [Burkholderia sp. Bp9031]
MENHVAEEIVWDERRYAQATQNFIRASDTFVESQIVDLMSDTVWLALQTEWSNELSCSQMEREFNVRVKLSQDWAVVPHALVRTADGPALIYEMTAGTSLSALAGKLSVAQFLSIAIGMARCIAKTHEQRLVHGDIRPANFVHESNGVVRIRSFMHACDLTGELRFRRQPSEAAAPYAAPERTMWEDAFDDERSDLYSLGITLFELLTGAYPFKASSLAEWLHAHVAIEPAKPGKHRADVPPILDEVILKLLSKDPNTRYQTAESLYHDLAYIEAAWTASGAAAPFDLARADRFLQDAGSGAFVGREGELRQLVDAYDDVALTGRASMVLIEGGAGLGKTMLVNRLRVRLNPSSQFCGIGKVDQYQSSQPYAPIVSALRSLLPHVAPRGDDARVDLTQGIRERLREHAGLLAQLAPEIGQALGMQEVEADWTDTMPVSRVHQILASAFSAFASPGSPLLLAIDDVQWADDATLDFFEALVADAPANLCVVITCRPADYDQTTRFRTFVERLRGICTTAIDLTPLQVSDVVRMIGSFLNEPLDRVRDLGELIHTKAEGNPFHVRQLLRALFDARLVRFDGDSHAWTWDGEAIERHHDAENVVELLEHRLEGLSPAERDMLSWLACIGTECDSGRIARILGTAHGDVLFRLEQARRTGFVWRRGEQWGFAHDRIREAAYGLLDPATRAARHERIAAAMISLSSAGNPDNVLDIAAQIERAIYIPVERARAVSFASMLILAAERTAAAAARDRTLAFLVSAEALVGKAAWSDTYDLTRALTVLRCRTLLATGHLENAAREIDALLPRMRSAIDAAEAYRLKAALLTVNSDYAGAVDVALEGLRLLGIDFPAQPSTDDLADAYHEIEAELAGRSIAELVALEKMNDARIEAAMGLLTALEAAMFYPSAGLTLLQLATMVRLTLQYGVTGASVQGLAWYGVYIADAYDAYEEGLAFAKVALALVDKHGFERYRTATLVALDQVSVWTQPLASALDYARQAKAAGNESAELRWQCYSCNHIVSDLIAMGETLPRIRDEIESLLTIARGAGYHDIVDLVATQAEFVESLQTGSGRTIGTWQSRGREIGHTERCDKPPMAVLSFWTLVLRGQSAFLLGDLGTAESAFEAAVPLTWSTPAHIMLSDFRLFATLTVIHANRGRLEPEQLLAKVTVHREQMATWSALNPGTFQNKLMLIEAEFERVRGNDLRAMQLYEASANMAAAQGFVHEQALAHELASRHAAESSLSGVARHHLRIAHACYRRWGALGKAARIEAQHSFVATDALPATTPLEIQGSTDLDFMVAMRTAQSLSEELDLERLVQSLMINMVVHAGAQYGVLILVRNGVPMIEASARVDGDDVVVDFTRTRPVDKDMPTSMLNRVMRTRKPLVFDDASTQGMPEHAASLAVRPTRSAFCLPLLKQGGLIGVLYLENALVHGVFTPKRTAMLEVLAPQAANSLETARLYTELIEENARRQEMEEALRRARTELAHAAHVTVMGELAASIAHEINQPLTSIVSSAGASLRWLGSAQPNIAEARSNLEDIRASGVRAADIVRALRSLAKQAPVTLAPVVIDDLVGEMLKLTAMEIDAKRVRLRVRLDSGGVEVLADRIQIQQVVLNLITNALDAMDGAEHPRLLDVASTIEAGHVVVSMLDSGPGIGESLMERIFDPFFTTKSHGMGMGLAICKSIMEVHGGMLTATAGPSGGAAFVFRLPLADIAH